MHKPSKPWLVWFYTILVFCGRGSGLCGGFRLQVHRNLCLSPPQCSRALWGHCEADPTAARQQRDQWAPTLHLQAKREHQQESQTLPRSTCSQEQQEDGPESALQVLSWPRSAVNPQTPLSPSVWASSFSVRKARGLVFLIRLLLKLDINSHFYLFIYSFQNLALTTFLSIPLKILRFCSWFLILSHRSNFW